MDSMTFWGFSSNQQPVTAHIHRWKVYLCSYQGLWQLLTFAKCQVIFWKVLQLAIVESHYIKQGYYRPPHPKELRGINETTLRHFQTLLGLYDKGCSIEAWLTLLVWLLIKAFIQLFFFNHCVPDKGERTDISKCFKVQKMSNLKVGIQIWSRKPYKDRRGFLKVSG